MPKQLLGQTIKKLTDEDLKAIVDAEIRGAMGELAGDLATQRADAMERYLGEPDGREMEGRSQVQARDVLDVVEWIMPTLMRLFGMPAAIEIEPVGPEDEQQAEQETEYLRQYFFKKCQSTEGANGFMILYTWIKDALLQKVGVTLNYPKEEKKVREETYTAQTDDQLAALFEPEDGIEKEIIERTTATATDMFTGQPIQIHDVKIRFTETKTKTIVDNYPPEQYLVSRDARSVNPKGARFNGVYLEVTISDLMEEGYEWEEIQLMEIGLNESTWSQEEVQRHHLSDEQRWLEIDTANLTMQTVKMVEGYIYVDMNGDGVAELVKFRRSGDWIEWEETDHHPVNAITPIPLPHKLIGLSVADLVMDIQEIRTGLFRAIMDSTIQRINGRTYFNDNVNTADLQTSRPWGNVHVEGNGPVSDSVMHVFPDGLPPQAYSLDEYIDKLRKDRIGDFMGQLDANVLANANNGVVVEMISEAKAKTEMIARVFAETGVRELFRDIHKLARQHSNREEMFRLRNEWVAVDPREWKERDDFTINIGTGTRSRAEKVADAEGILGMQERIAAAGSRIVQDHNVYEAGKDFAEALGFRNPDKYFTNPQMLPPEEPEPDPQLLIAQVHERVVYLF